MEHWGEIVARPFTRVKSDCEMPAVIVAAVPRGQTAAPCSDFLWRVQCPSARACAVVFMDRPEEEGIPELLIHPGYDQSASMRLWQRCCCYCECTPKYPGVEGALELRWELRVAKGAKVEDVADLARRAVESVVSMYSASTGTGVPDISSCRESPWHWRVPRERSGSGSACVAM